MQPRPAPAGGARRPAAAGRQVAGPAAFGAGIKGPSAPGAAPRARAGRVAPRAAAGAAASPLPQQQCAAAPRLPARRPFGPASQQQQQRRQQQQQQQRRGVRAAAAGNGAPPGGDGQGGGKPDAFGRVGPSQPQSWDRLPDPWDTTAAGRARPASTSTVPPPPPPPPGYNGANGAGRGSRYEATDWGWDAPEQNWDLNEGLSPEQRASLQADYDAMLARQRAAEDPPRDKWITPLLDWQSITGAFDPDQRRTEDAMTDEALTNKNESRDAIAFAGRLIAIPLVTGALVGRALAEPVLGFTLANNPDAFAMTGRQKIEGSEHVHQEEARRWR
ncbi:hypothetical protein Rsub_02931 [Raphidocelis subcapitata]|uniref:Uncharacterized protein n=1 Tax=Raphidocelis subcapitata TaxID=307507 RepID=A0A2V0NQ38_9CHLO|nr:hypothetical protein Rsub_02931 [Raphidocelis subcapitata]|eukprot:GBF89761.1 hypothetical protein Rsub_02931 [Raphidocelis subcapitata]